MVDKINKIIIVSFIIIFIASACSYDLNSEELSQFKSNETSIEENSFNQYKCVDMEEINIVIEKEVNYIIYTNKPETVYRYEVVDNEGNYIDGGYDSWRGGLSFSYENDLLELRVGSGTYAWSTRYYDLENGNVSRFYQTPIQTTNELIAYFGTNKEGKTVLCVQNIFDKKKYFEEFYRNFSSVVVTGTSEAEFINNNTQLKVTFGVYEGDKKEDIYITETFDLKLSKN